VASSILLLFDRGFSFVLHDTAQRKTMGGVWFTHYIGVGVEHNKVSLCLKVRSAWLCVLSRFVSVLYNWSWLIGVLFFFCCGYNWSLLIEPSYFLFNFVKLHCSALALAFGFSW